MLYGGHCYRKLGPRLHTEGSRWCQVQVSAGELQRGVCSLPPFNLLPPKGSAVTSPVSSVYRHDDKFTGSRRREDIQLTHSQCHYEYPGGLICAITIFFFFFLIRLEENPSSVIKFASVSIEDYSKVLNYTQRTRKQTKRQHHKCTDIRRQ